MTSADYVESLCAGPHKGMVDAKVSFQDALRYLGYADQGLDQELKARLRQAARACESDSRPSYLWQAYRIATRDKAQHVVHLERTDITLEGESVERHLDGACAVALLCVTLGLSNEMGYARLNSVNFNDALMYSACGSSLVEAAADDVDELICAEAAVAGLYVNDRFSPGYGDLPLALQQELVEELNLTKLLGVTVGDSLMLTPTKTVTAVVGLFDYPPKRGLNPCDACGSRSTCKYLKKGMTCHGK